MKLITRSRMELGAELGAFWGLAPSHMAPGWDTPNSRLLGTLDDLHRFVAVAQTTWIVLRLTRPYETSSSPFPLNGVPPPTGERIDLHFQKEVVEKNPVTVQCLDFWALCSASLQFVDTCLFWMSNPSCLDGHRWSVDRNFPPNECLTQLRCSFPLPCGLQDAATHSTPVTQRAPAIPRFFDVDDGIRRRGETDCRGYTSTLLLLLAKGIACFSSKDATNGAPGLY